METMRRMAAVVDQQNAADPVPADGAGFDGIAFPGGLDLVLKGQVQPNGYTEPVLHARRKELQTAATGRLTKRNAWHN